MSNALTAALAASEYDGRGFGPVVGVLIILVWLAVVLVVLAGIWKVFAKAGEPGWASLVPIYNIGVLLRIAGKPNWWLLLMFIPAVGAIVAILVSLALARSFGKGVGFGLGLALLPAIFVPILGFGSAAYEGTAWTSG